MQCTLRFLNCLIVLEDSASGDTISSHTAHPVFLCAGKKFITLAYFFRAQLIGFDSWQDGKDAFAL